MRCDFLFSSFRVIRSNFLSNVFSWSFENPSMNRKYHTLSILVIFNIYFKRASHRFSVFTFEGQWKKIIKDMDSISLKLEKKRITCCFMKRVIIMTYCLNIQESRVLYLITKIWRKQRYYVVMRSNITFSGPNTIKQNWIEEMMEGFRSSLRRDSGMRK